MAGVPLRLIPLMLVILVALAWWYPTPELVEVEAVDWAARYERAYAPDTALQRNFARFGLPSDRMQAELRAARRAERVVEPLPAFIDRETEGAMLTGDADVWRPVLQALTEGGEAFVLPESVPVPLPVFDQVHVAVAAETGPRFLVLRRTATADVWSWEDIPDGLLFPLRDGWPLLLGGLAGAVALPVAGGLARTRRPAARAVETSHGRAVVWTLGMTLVGAALMAMPHLYGIWGADIGFAATMVGLLLVLTGVLSALLFLGAVRALDRLLSGRERLVRWVFPAEDWLAFVGEDLGRQRERAWGLLALIGGIMVLVGAGFLLFAEDTEAAWSVVVVLGGVFVLLLLVAVLAPWLGARRLRRGPFEVQVGPRALYRGGQSHVWGGLLGRFEGAAVKTEGDRTLLLVRYSFLQAVGGRSLYFYRRYETVPVPVPAGQEAEADRVARALNAAHGGTAGSRS
jgi:hypothetical protein